MEDRCTLLNYIRLDSRLPQASVAEIQNPGGFRPRILHIGNLVWVPFDIYSCSCCIRS
jgi:hypothetical protein